MKKTFLGVMALLAIGATQVGAQSPSGGIKAEVNLSNFILSDLPGVDSKLGVGGTVGAFVKFDMSKGFAFQPELLFNFQTSKLEEGNYSQDFHYYGLEVPVYAMWQWEFSPGTRFYAGLGPYLGVGLVARYKNPDVKLYENDFYQPLDFGFKATLGYEFANRLQVNASYRIGLIDAKYEGAGSMLPEAIALGVGYRF